jgi:hypothetical protein
MMREEFLYFIWEHRLYHSEHLRTTCGQNLEIIHPGTRNIHAGPDYSDARIRAGHLVWAGNVEIHTCSGDWKKHGHHLDPAYNNVILHVVHQYRGEVVNASGGHIFTCVISFPQQIYFRYEKLVGCNGWLPCEHHITNVPDTLRRRWLIQLSRGRLEKKSDPVCKLLKDRRLSREETFYRVLAAGFGLPNNSLPFLLLSSRVPYLLLCEIRDSLSDLEALFFGHSGLVDAVQDPSSYSDRLLEHYRRLSTRLSTRPVPAHLWHFHRLRPPAFPTVKLALFSALIHQRLPLEQTILRATSLAELEQMFRVKASSFWDSHYLFGKSALPVPRYLGVQSVQILIINSVVPYLHALGRAEMQKSYMDRARNLLQEVEAESNYIIKNWIKFGVKPRNAQETQGLIQLYRAYCSRKQCLQCMFGVYLLDKQE